MDQWDYCWRTGNCSFGDDGGNFQQESSLRDINCARQLPALSIGVATGVHSADNLKNAGADYVFKDLIDTEKVMLAIESNRDSNLKPVKNLI